MNIQQLEKSSPHDGLYDVRSQLKRFIYDRSNEAFAAGDAARDAITTVEQLQSRQRSMREKLIENIGGLPPSDTPLNAQVVGEVKCNGFRIERVIFESRPQVYVTANVYIPDGVMEPTGAVLFLCGHHRDAKHVEEYQIVCRYLVKAGLVVMAQDPVGQGERFSYYEPSLGRETVNWGVMEHGYAGAQCLPLGDTIARYFVHDSMRSVDYLFSRPEVNPQRIGVTGDSGGGTQTSLMMICDPRVAAAAPGTFIMTRQSFMYNGGGQDAEQIWPGMSALGFDHEDILLMMAPKPVRVVAVTWDFFPIEGTRRTVQRCKRLWDLYGKGSSVDMAEDVSRHAYTRPLARAAGEFFSLHLNGEKVTPVDGEIEAIEPSKLWCASSGQVRGEMAGARFVHDENVDRLAEVERRREAMPESERREKALAWLRERVTAYRKPCDLNPRVYADVPSQDLTVQMACWWAQDGIFNNGYAFRDCLRENEDLPVTLAIWDGGTTVLQPHLNWMRRTCAEGRAVVVLDTSGVGSLLPHPADNRPQLDYYAIVFKLVDDLFWLDDSLAAMRTYDVLRALDMLEAWPNLRADDVRLYAHGRQGVYGQFATALDDRVKRIEVVESMGSYAEWVAPRHYDPYDIQSIILPGMLKHFDLPDLERWGGERYVRV